MRGEKPVLSLTGTTKASGLLLSDKGRLERSTPQERKGTVAITLKRRTEVVRLIMKEKGRWDSVYPTSKKHP